MQFVALILLGIFTVPMEQTTKCLKDSKCQSGQICESRVCLVGCRRNKDCRDNEVCANRQCSNPCNYPGVCGIGARCMVDNHNVICTCPPSLTGNPYIQCIPVLKEQRVVCLKDSDCQSGQICESRVCLVGCRRNEDCQDNEACANRQCSKPCSYPDVCGIGAECLVDNHNAICSCPSSLTGDPNIQCFPA